MARFASVGAGARVAAGGTLMAARPIWRGHLRLALVSCPITLQTVHKSGAGLHFHFINPDTGNRVRQVTVDAETDEEVSRGELARGFEYEKGRYVVLDEADFESARVDSSSLLTIDKFVPMSSIDPIYYDQSYYLTPDGDLGGGVDVYVVLRDAIARTGKVALSRLVIARRERAVAIHPLGRGLVLHTLHDAADVASTDEAFSSVPAAKPEPDMVDLARQLIERQTGRFEPSDLVDRYEARLREVIDAKVRGEDPEPPPGHAGEDDNVVDLMAALRRSLGQETPDAGRRAASARGSGAASARGTGAAKGTVAAGRAPPLAKRKSPGSGSAKTGPGKAGSDKVAAAKAGSGKPASAGTGSKPDARTRTAPPAPGRAAARRRA